MWKEGLQVALQANIPALVWGPPGIGKTAHVVTLAAAASLPLEVVIASIRDPSDFLGLPVRQNGDVAFHPPRWARRLKDAGHGLLVFDELTTAPPAVQAALLRVVLERVVGDLELPSGVRIVALANPVEQVSGWELSLPLSNRFVHFKAERPRAKDFCHGLTTGEWGSKLELQREKVSDGKGLVSGFLMKRAELVFDMPNEDAEERNSWPSPRSWEILARLVDWVPKEAAPLLATVAVGAVGEGAGFEFAKWVQDVDLPDPEYVLEKGERYAWDKNRLDKVFAILSSALHFVESRVEGPEGGVLWEKMWKVLVGVSEVALDLAAHSAVKLAKMRQAHFEVPADQKVRRLINDELAEMLDLK